MPASIRYGLALFAGLAAAPVLIYCAAPFFAAAWRTLRARAPGMDVLVATGAGASCLLSVWRLANGESAVYFDSASMIVTFLLAGRLIDTTVRGRSADAVRCLLELPSETAHVVGTDGAETVTLAKRVEPGATIRVRPGECVPLDGVVVRGASSLDRSLLTGESACVHAGPGDFVEAGVMNGEGELVLEVRHAVGGASCRPYRAQRAPYALAQDGFAGARGTLHTLSCAGHLHHRGACAAEEPAKRHGRRRGARACRRGARHHLSPARSAWPCRLRLPRARAAPHARVCCFGTSRPSSAPGISALFSSTRPAP